MGVFRTFTPLSLSCQSYFSVIQKSSIMHKFVICYKCSSPFLASLVCNASCPQLNCVYKCRAKGKVDNLLINQIISLWAICLQITLFWSRRWNNGERQLASYCENSIIVHLIWTLVELRLTYTIKRDNFYISYSNHSLVLWPINLLIQLIHLELVYSCVQYVFN